MIWLNVKVRFLLNPPPVTFLIFSHIFISDIILMSRMGSSCILSPSMRCFHLYWGQGPMFGIKVSMVEPLCCLSKLHTRVCGFEFFTEYDIGSVYHIMILEMENIKFKYAAI